MRRDVQVSGIVKGCRKCRGHTVADADVLVGACGYDSRCLGLMSLHLESDAAPFVSMHCNLMEEYGK